MATNCVLCALVVCDVTPSFVLLLHVCCWVVVVVVCVCVCVCVCSGNKLDAWGAMQALAPSVAKLTQLQTLDLRGEWSVFWRNLCVYVLYLPLCGLWFVCTLLCVSSDVCCFERL